VIRWICRPLRVEHDLARRRRGLDVQRRGAADALAAKVGKQVQRDMRHPRLGRPGIAVDVARLCGQQHGCGCGGCGTRAA
jgi:hypothetical protein